MAIVPPNPQGNKMHHRKPPSAYLDYPKPDRDPPDDPAGVRAAAWGIAWVVILVGLGLIIFHGPAR